MKQFIPTMFVTNLDVIFTGSRWSTFVLEATVLEDVLLDTDLVTTQMIYLKRNDNLLFCHVINLLYLKESFESFVL